MLGRRSLGLVVVISFSFVWTAKAQTQPTAAEQEQAATPAPAAAEPPPKSLLDDTLSKWEPTKPLEDNGWTFGGWIEGGYTYDLTDPSVGTIPGMVFNTDQNQFIVNQMEFHFGRPLTASKDKFDIGGFVDFMYGTDARYIHANGMNWYGQSKHNFAVETTPQYQLDLTQANLQFNLPVGNGILVTAGKFVTLLGYETINPNTDPLYSHSYLFGFAIPFTHTGIIGAYNINDKLSITGGITRGWEQATDDNNGAIDGIGQIKWVPTDKLTFYLNAITGPEQTNNNTDYRTVIDFIASWTAADNLTLAVNADYGFEPNSATDGGYGVWGGVAGYVAYKFDSHVTFNGRAEWFNDNDGARSGGALGSDVYEVTLGATITPFPDNRVAQTLRFRPEVRYDWSPDDVFGNGTDKDQLTLAVDAIWSF